MSVVYGTTANVAGAAIRNFRIDPSLSNRIESGRPIRIRIESEASQVLSKSYIRCLWACIFTGHWDIGDVKARNGPKLDFFSNFWPILSNPLAKVDGSMLECAQVCALHATALDAAEENRNGRRLNCSRRNPQNWYYVTQFLAHPVEPRERLVHTDATVG